jgi:murein DD-endopeptidase
MSPRLIRPRFRCFLALLLCSTLAARAALGAGACRYRELTLNVHGSLAASFARDLGQDGNQLAAHLARIFMWDLDMRRDVEAGDEVHLLWRPVDGVEGVEIGAASYRSRRLGQTLLAYRFTPGGDDYASYWDPGGVERARRLEGSPLAQYEQITALLKDRPTHQGMDFKTPVGTPVRAPRGGVVTRIDWKPPGNGRCVEVRYDDGTLAKFLHLSAIQVRSGARVRAGQVLALSGNTGHSTAPHLHYQLSRGGRTLDPVDYHGVTRRKLAARDAAVLRDRITALTGECGALGK